VNSSFTVLWNSERVKIARLHGLLEQPIPFLFGGPHTSQPSFIRAGVGPSDIIYPIFVKNGAVHILARVVTREIVSLESFVSARTDLYPADKCGRWTGETLMLAVGRQPWLRAFNWTCSDHVLLPDNSSPLTTSVTLPIQALERLTYRSQKAERPLKGVQDGRLGTITGLQGVYRLAELSAADFLAATASK
jgi:hypothetical protein